MQLILDLSNDGEAEHRVTADVLSVISYDGAKLYAVVVPDHQGAPWFGLIHEASTTLVQVARP
jgi:hypothetical protein